MAYFSVMSEKNLSRLAWGGVAIVFILLGFHVARGFHKERVILPGHRELLRPFSRVQSDDPLLTTLLGSPVTVEIPISPLQRSVNVTVGWQAKSTTTPFSFGVLTGPSLYRGEDATVFTAPSHIITADSVLLATPTDETCAFAPYCSRATFSIPWRARFDGSYRLLLLAPKGEVSLISLTSR